MTIQILKQRPYTDKQGKLRTPMKLVNLDKNPETIQELFENLDFFLGQIPAKEHWNLHYTLCNCVEGEKPRTFKSQSVIPIDIDNADTTKMEEYLEAVASALNLNVSDMGSVISGGGYHFLIGTTHQINDSEYFKLTEKFYKIICERVNTSLKNRGLKGSADPGLWSAGHTLRLPGTKNIKTPETGYPNKHFEGDCKLINPIINPLGDVTVSSLVGNELKDDEFLPVKTQSLGGKIATDDDAVLSGCAFLNWCKENPEEVKEPQWYAMLGITGFLKEADTIVHNLSKDNSQYDYEETQQKVEQARCYGPRTCDSVSRLFDGCRDCDHFGKVTSPITIKSDSFIATRETGFRELKHDKNGAVIPGKIIYEDLVKYYDELHPHMATDEGVVYTYTGTHWEMTKKGQILSFAWEHIQPETTDKERREFHELMKITNVKPESWFDTTSHQKMNLKNGVLDLKTKKFLNHSTDYGFKTCLNYDYDPDAECPVFDRFMKEITCNDKDLESILLEYAGYCFSNADPIFQKALMLLGEGRNGKSTFIEVIQEIAGEGAYSSLGINDLNDKSSRADMYGKLFNANEETSTKGFKETSNLKNLITGGSTQIHIFYHGKFSVKMKTKLIMGMNSIPETSDTTEGFMRRLLIVPFNAKFEEQYGNVDREIKYKMFKECSGILNRIIEGHDRLFSQKGFTASEEVTSVVEEYREDMDFLGTFLKENFQKTNDINHKVKSSEIYKLYIRYCEDYSIQIKDRLNQRSLGIHLKKHPFLQNSFRRMEGGSFYTRIKPRVGRVTNNFPTYDPSPAHQPAPF